MDKQEYLNQISAHQTPAKKSPLDGLLHSKFLWIGLVAVVLLVIIMGVGTAINSNKPSGKENLYQLILHINNTSAVISEYQTYVKSSDLRSYSASLGSVLSNTNRDLTNYATTAYNYKEKDIPKTTVADETTAQTELKDELFEAKINGILDRIYAHKMAYEISLIMSLEQQVAKLIKNSDLQATLSSSYDSLSNLYHNFDDFTAN